jgi:hypothetical protein
MRSRHRGPTSIAGFNADSVECSFIVTDHDKRKRPDRRCRQADLGDTGPLRSAWSHRKRGAPDHTVRIVAALVNPVGPAPEAETVTLLNASPEAVDLTGWSILDRDKRRLVLDAGELAAGDSLRVLLQAPVALGNRGGLISLLDPDGLKVDGVAYTKAQAEREGWSLVF